jgi:SNF2 family DNA or RNA helicase
VLEGARIEGESIYNETSTKIQKIMEILDGMRDEKVIIFTHWKKEMEELRHVIDGMGLPCMSIDGSVSVENRKATCDDFNSREGGCVLLSQIQVGGCGLNLQACQTVILPSLDWSPSVEMQAIARAHRIGVNHPVKVHRIIAKGSIDEHVLRIQSEKLL